MPWTAAMVTGSAAAAGVATRAVNASAAAVGTAKSAARRFMTSRCSVIRWDSGIVGLPPIGGRERPYVANLGRSKGRRNVHRWFALAWQPCWSSSWVWPAPWSTARLTSSADRPRSGSRPLRVVAFSALDRARPAADLQPVPRRSRLRRGDPLGRAERHRGIDGDPDPLRGARDRPDEHPVAADRGHLGHRPGQLGTHPGRAPLAAGLRRDRHRARRGRAGRLRPREGRRAAEAARGRATRPCRA